MMIVGVGVSTKIPYLYCSPLHNCFLSLEKLYSCMGHEGE